MAHIDNIEVSHSCSSVLMDEDWITLCTAYPRSDWNDRRGANTAQADRERTDPAHGGGSGLRAGWGIQPIP